VNNLYNYPNPYNGSTTIGYELENPGQVKLEVFSVEGELLTTLVNGYQQPGIHEISYESPLRNRVSGVLIVRLTTRDFTKVIRMIQVK
jgi:hypothetical protein